MYKTVIFQQRRPQHQQLCVYELRARHLFDVSVGDRCAQSRKDYGPRCHDLPMLLLGLCLQQVDGVLEGPEQVLGHLVGVRVGQCPVVGKHAPGGKRLLNCRGCRVGRIWRGDARMEWLEMAASDDAFLASRTGKTTWGKRDGPTPTHG